MGRVRTENPAPRKIASLAVPVACGSPPLRSLNDHCAAIHQYARIASNMNPAQRLDSSEKEGSSSKAPTRLCISYVPLFPSNSHHSSCCAPRSGRKQQLPSPKGTNSDQKLFAYFDSVRCSCGTRPMRYTCPKCNSPYCSRECYVVR